MLGDQVLSADFGLPGWPRLGPMEPHTGRRMNGAQSRLEKTLVELNGQRNPFHPQLKGQSNFPSEVLAAQATLPNQVATKMFKSGNHRSLDRTESPFSRGRVRLLHSMGR